MPDLKPCPCGKTPTKLVAAPSYLMNWVWVSGDCCGMWAIEFKRGQDESKRGQDMTTAWNDAPRKGEG